MKWTTALTTLELVAERCAHVAAQPPGIIRLRVTEAWVHGDLLGVRREEVDDVGGLRVALVCDVGAAEFPWGAQAHGAGQWLAASGLEKKPVRLVLRPADAPVENHAVVRPVRFWTLTDGLDHEVLRVLRAGDGEHLRPDALPAQEAARQLTADLAVSLAAVRAASADYAEHRWSPGSPVKRADTLAGLVQGYLELLTAQGASEALAGAPTGDRTPVAADGAPSPVLP